MKKVMFALAIAGMFSFAACNSAKNNQEVVAEEEVIEAVEEVVEDSAVEAMAEEAVEEVSEVVANN